MINSSLTQFFFVFKFFVSKCQNLLRVLVFFSSFVFSLSHSAFNVLILCLALQSNRFGPTIFFLLGSALAWCTHTWFYWLNWIFLPLLLFSVVDGSRTLLVSLCFFSRYMYTSIILSLRVGHSIWSWSVFRFNPCVWVCVYRVDECVCVRYVRNERTCISNSLRLCVYDLSFVG